LKIGLRRGGGKGFFAVAGMGVFFMPPAKKLKKTLRDQRMAGSDFMRKVF
jgi:hypothetical protein